jgi:hypothetical protein
VRAAFNAERWIVVAEDDAVLIARVVGRLEPTRRPVAGSKPSKSVSVPPMWTATVRGMVPGCKGDCPLYTQISNNVRNYCVKRGRSRYPRSSYRELSNEVGNNCV